MTIHITEEPADVDQWIWHGEDYYEPVFQFVDPLTGDPWDITGVSFEWYARPSFDYTTLLLRLTSALSPGGILIDDAATGLISFFKSKEAIEAALPISSNPTGWRQFLRASWSDPELGTVEKLIWTGALTVHPARDDL